MKTLATIWRRWALHELGALLGSGFDQAVVSQIRVHESVIEEVATGLYALNSSSVLMERTLVRNVQGPSPRGQAAQFDKVTGAGNGLICNVAVNEPGRSRPEDAISMFRSRGTPESPIVIHGNKVLGGGPSGSGGGILVGDYGGGHIRVSSNILVDPGQYGLAIAGGEHMSLIDNAVYVRRKAFTNVGLYVWRTSPEGGPCHSHTIRGNQIDYTNSKGRKNPYYKQGNCRNVSDSGSDNSWHAKLGEEIMLRKIESCRQHADGPN